MDVDLNLTESNVIGCLIIDPTLIKEAQVKLSPRMFTNELLAKTFAEMLNQKKFDFVSLVAALGEQEYKIPLYEISSSAFPAGFTTHVDIIFQEWRKKDLHERLTAIALGDEKADDITDELERIVGQQREIVKQIQQDTCKRLYDAIYDTVVAQFSADTSIKTEWGLFNAITGGLQRGCLYTIAARTGMGKTDFSVQLATQLSKKYHVRYQTIEMTVDQITQRILSRACRINSTRFRDKQLDKNDQSQVVRVIELLKDLNLFIDDEPHIDIERVKSHIMQTHPDVVFIDHLGIMDSSAGNKKEWEIVSKLTRGFKLLAKETNTAIVLLVQLNRDVDRRKGQPTLADLRGGSSIEQDSDGVFFVCPEPHESFLSGDESAIMSLVIAKNRYGSTGTMEFKWQPQYHTYNPIDNRYE